MRASFWNLTDRGERLTDEEMGYSFYANRLVGVPRLRQLRVKEDTCQLRAEVKGVLTGRCLGHYSPMTESVKTFGKPDGYACLRLIGQGCAC